MNDLISVIVPVYNIENDLLDKCISSIINQTYRNLEIIIVDDGSRKETADECDRLAETDSRIIVIHQKNKGVSAARNAGLDIANGDYIGFADPDDYLEKDMFELLYITLCQDNSDICVCGFNLVYGNGDIKKREFYSGHKVFDKQEAYKELMIDKEINSCVWNKLYKRELFDNVRFPVGKRFEDCFIIHKLFYFCSRISVVSAYLYNYYQRSDSIMNDIDIYKFKERVESLKMRLEFTVKVFPQYTDLVYESIIKVSLKYLLNPINQLKTSRKIYIDNSKEAFEILESGRASDVAKTMSKYYDSYVFLMKHRYSVFLKSMRFILKGLNIA